MNKMKIRMMLLLLLLSFSEIALSQEVTYKNGDTLRCKENTYRVYVHNYETMSLAWKLVSLSDIYLLNVRNGFLNEDVRQTIWDERRELQYWEGMETEDSNGNVFGFDKIVYKHLEPWLPSLMNNRMALKCYMLFDKNGKIQELVFNLCGQSSQVSNNVWQKVSPEAFSAMEAEIKQIICLRRAYGDEYKKMKKIDKTRLWRAMVYVYISDYMPWQDEKD